MELSITKNMMSNIIFKEIINSYKGNHKEYLKDTRNYVIKCISSNSNDVDLIIKEFNNFMYNNILEFEIIECSNISSIHIYLNNKKGKIYVYNVNDKNIMDYILSIGFIYDDKYIYKNRYVLIKGECI